MACEMEVAENYLIIGGIGYLGSQLANYVPKKDPDSELVIYDRLSKNSDFFRLSRKLTDSLNFSVVIGDAANEPLLFRTLDIYHISIVFYCAMSVEESESEWNPTAVARENLLALTHSLNAVRKYKKLKKFVYVSSEEVYGDVYETKLETFTLKPTSSISASQCGAEAMINAYVTSYRLPLVIARLSQIVYGGNMKESNLLYKILEGSNRTKNTSRYGIIHVAEAVEGLFACAERGKAGEIYNIGSNYDVTDEIVRQLYKAVRNDEDPMKIELLNTLMCTEKAWTCLEWRPKQQPPQPLLGEALDKFEFTVDEQLTLTSLNFLLYGENTYIGKKLTKLMNEQSVPYILAKCEIGTDLDAAVLQEIVGYAPSHIIAVFESKQNKGAGPHKLCKNVRENLYAPWLLASYCDRLRIHLTYISSGDIFTFDNEHFVGGAMFTEDDCPNYYANCVSVVKGYTDRLMKVFPNTLNARIRLPLDWDDEPQNLLTKIRNSSKLSNTPESITVLPDCLPILFDMALNRTCGTINLVNPGPIRLTEIAEKYKRIINPTLEYEYLEPEDDETEPHCILDTKRLTDLYPGLITASRGIDMVLDEGVEKKT